MPERKKHGIELLLSQYQNSPNLKQYISLLIEEFMILRVVFAEVVKYRYLAKSFGVQVDDVAYLVGASRVIYGAAPIGYFGYYDNAQALGAGDDNDRSEGGVFKGDGDKDSNDLILNDSQLKGAIRARIIKTVTNCSINDLLLYCDLLVGRELDIEIIETPASIKVRYHGTFSLNERALMANILPDIKPVGVNTTLVDDSGNIDMRSVGKDYPVKM
ncbi:DUF2612 domain-containing protein [Hafnia alvei]|nr:DUF2612 domain-containing protein [Hafnia alvei]MBI0275399.1 DUF2612 domain-containing protein [Hafnia alvei]PNK98606.1 hypothetical protein CEQ28_013930 [Hafnia alvei]